MPPLTITVHDSRGSRVVYRDDKRSEAARIATEYDKGQITFPVAYRQLKKLGYSEDMIRATLGGLDEGMTGTPDHADCDCDDCRGKRA